MVRRSARFEMATSAHLFSAIFFFIYYFFFFFVFPPPNYKLIRIKEEEKKNEDARTQVKDDRSYVTITNRCLPCWHAKTSLSDLIAKEKNAPFSLLFKRNK